VLVGRARLITIPGNQICSTASSAVARVVQTPAAAIVGSILDEVHGSVVAIDPAVVVDVAVSRGEGGDGKDEGETKDSECKPHEVLLSIV